MKRTSVPNYLFLFSKNIYLYSSLGFDELFILIDTSLPYMEYVCVRMTEIKENETRIEKGIRHEEGN